MSIFNEYINQVAKVKDELENLLINRGFTNFTDAVGHAHREGN